MVDETTIDEKIVEEEFEKTMKWEGVQSVELGSDICKLYIWTNLICEQDGLELPMYTKCLLYLVCLFTIAFQFVITVWVFIYFI